MRPVARPAVLVLALVLPLTVLAPSAASGSTAPELRASMGPFHMVARRPGGAPVGGSVAESSISADGRFVTYTTRNTSVVGLPRNGYEQVFRFDRRTGATVLVSATPDGLPGTGESADAASSADGRVVVFRTRAADVVGLGDGLDDAVVVARDMVTGATSLVSRTPAGEVPTGSSYDPLVSDDGSLVTFRTQAIDITGFAGAVVHDRTTGTSSAVTVDADGTQVVVERAWLSGDGSTIAFADERAGIVPGDDNGAADVFLLDRVSGDLTLVSRTVDGTVADDESYLFDGGIDPYSSPKPVLSADGSVVVFVSDASDLAGAEGTSGSPQWTEGYAYDVATASATLVTARPDGSPADDSLRAVTVSSDGRYVGLRSQAFLAGGSGPLGPKIFVRDLDRATTRAASSNSYGTSPGLGGGRHVQIAFASFDELVDDDTDDQHDVYLRRVW